MSESARIPAVRNVDPERLAEFRSTIRRRYTKDELLEQLRGCAERLGRSPTIRDFEADTTAKAHPQTLIDHFGSWNAAKREAGLVPRRFISRQELLDVLRRLGDTLGRTPTGRDLDERRGTLPSKSLYWHTFGSLAAALQEAGFDVPIGPERLERALEQGVDLSVRIGRLPKFADWAEAHAADASLLSEWQVYRLFDARKGSWSAFQYLIRERLLAAGVDVRADGAIL